MTPFQATAVIASLPALVACASISSGTSQKLTINTDPSGADCQLMVKDAAIGNVNPTPGAITVKRASDSIRVTCRKDGYQDATYVNKPGLEAATLGNIVLGGVIGLAVDAASGANNRYEEVMTLRLEPASAALAKPQPAPAASETGQQPQAVARIERYPSNVAEFHCPAAGTIIRTSAHSSFKFTNGTGFTCAYVDQDGTARERYAIFADGYSRLAKRDLDGLWPLRVGNRVEFRNADTNTPNFLSRRDYDESFTVVRQEPVTVPAGTFDTFVIEWHETGFSQIYRSDAIITLWYAPRSGYFVKSTVKVVDADARDPVAQTQYSGMDYEATEVVLADTGPVSPPALKPWSQPDNIRNAGNPP
ncbi:MAG TPA: hypothetical protein VJN67_04590 [Stellaceae bacterium]|nr:hypothetical protein [Stellaceae bacterium]